LEGVLAVNYHQLLEVLRDFSSLVKCSNCNRSLELCEISTKNFMKKGEEVYVSAICFKCGFEHKFKLLSRGVWGLIEVNDVKVHSINDYIDALRSRHHEEAVEEAGESIEV